MDAHCTGLHVEHREHVGELRGIDRLEIKDALDDSAESSHLLAGGRPRCAWVGLLEEIVRGYPTQWFNFFDVWTPRPS